MSLPISLVDLLLVCIVRLIFDSWQYTARNSDKEMCSRKRFFLFADFVHLFVLIFCISVVRLWCMAGRMGEARIDHVQ
jgi:hypothetical protein